MKKEYLFSLRLRASAVKNSIFFASARREPSVIGGFERFPVFRFTSYGLRYHLVEELMLNKVIYEKQSMANNE